MSLEVPKNSKMMSPAMVEEFHEQRQRRGVFWPTIFLDILYENEQTGAMLLKRPQQIPSSEITPEHVYVNRRQFLAVAALAAGNSVVPGSAYAAGKYDTNEKQSPL